MFVFGARSLRKLDKVHPKLILGLSRGLLYTPYDFAIDNGLRTMVEQYEYLAAGKSWTLKSKHLVQPDGYCHAVDIRAVGDLNGDGHVDHTDRSRTWDRKIYTAIWAQALFKAFGELRIAVRWGGDWDCDGDTGDTKHFDGPHIELI
jgi:peptidoglycan L-alanyl-D-glutamate endopeptidase CwlK